MEFKEICIKTNALIDNIEGVVRGKREAVELSVATLLSKGHLLIEDVPGVGKTTLAHSLAKSIDSSFQRIQFTSDLLPSDVIGVTIYNQATQGFDFRHGPLFANVVLADEINRATPKTQSALLEAMNEGQVSVENITYQLPNPFFLVATQNPMEYAGTFPLPESQLDRFALRITLGYPNDTIEKEIITTGKSLNPESLSSVVTTGELLEIQEAVERIKVEEDLSEYMVALVNETRSHRAVRLGVSPRGTMSLYKASQAIALISGREYCTPDDVKLAARPVLSHRVMPVEYGAEEGSRSSDIIDEVLDKVRVPI